MGPGARHRSIELHGNASYAKCLSCGTRHELDDLKREFEATDEIPTCRECGDLVKTATISFGQSMPEREMLRARAATLACDLFLVLGSSLVVYPAADFPIDQAEWGGIGAHRTSVARRRDVCVSQRFRPLAALRSGAGLVYGLNPSIPPRSAPRLWPRSIPR